MRPALKYPRVNVYIDVENQPFVDDFPETMGFLTKRLP